MDSNPIWYESLKEEGISIQERLNWEEKRCRDAKEEDTIFQPRREAQPPRQVILGFDCPAWWENTFLLLKNPRPAFCLVDLPKIISFGHGLAFPSQSKGLDNADHLYTFTGTYHLSTGLLYINRMFVHLLAPFVPSLAFFPPKIKSKGTLALASLIFFSLTFSL